MLSKQSSVVVLFRVMRSQSLLPWQLLFIQKIFLAFLFYKKILNSFLNIFTFYTLQFAKKMLSSLFFFFFGVLNKFLVGFDTFVGAAYYLRFHSNVLHVASLYKFDLQVKCQNRNQDNLLHFAFDEHFWAPLI